MFYFLSNTLYRAKKTLDFAQRQMDFPIPFSGSANFKGKTSISNIFFSKDEECFNHNSQKILKQRKINLENIIQFEENTNTLYISKAKHHTPDKLQRKIQVY